RRLARFDAYRPGQGPAKLRSRRCAHAVAKRTRDLSAGDRSKASEAFALSWRIQGAHARRPGAVAADFLEPDQQRGEVYSAERTNHDYYHQRFQRPTAC